MSRDELDIIKRCVYSMAYLYPYSDSEKAVDKRNKRGTSVIIKWQDFESFCIMLGCERILKNMNKKNFKINTKDLGIEV